MKTLFLVIDGLADRPAQVLDGLTPLEAASTPNLDAVVSRGSGGIHCSLGPGVPPGTDTAHFVFFGNALEDYPGRALFEAAGEGLAVEEGDVVLKGSFCHVEPRDGLLHLIRRQIDIDGLDASDLVDAIAEFETSGHRLQLVHTAGKESILYVRGGSPSNAITDSDPYADDAPVVAVEAMDFAGAQASATAEAVTAYLRFAHEVLAAHPINERRVAAGEAPANFLTTKWAATRRPLVKFSQRFPFRGASVAWGTLFRGLCAELGLTFRNVDYLEDPGEDLARRIDVAIDMLGSDSCDFVHVHTKLVDHAAHKKDPELKRRTIEACDAGLARLAALRDPETLLVVTADHATASSGDPLLIHTGEPVPIAVTGRTVPVDDVTRFSERACRHGLLGPMSAADLMPQVLNWTDRTGYYGARMSPYTQIARPAVTNPFTIEEPAEG